MSKKVYLILSIVMLISICCCLLGSIAAISYLAMQRDPAESSQSLYSPDSSVTQIPPEANPNAPSILLLPEDQAAALHTLELLENTIIPVNNPPQLAEQLSGYINVPVALSGIPRNLQVGEIQDFWATNTDTDAAEKRTAVLRYETEHVYFWVEEALDVRQEEIERLAETFENEIYPTTRAFFGSEWSPGVDNDPHLYILLASNLGSGVAAYFSSIDEYTHPVHENTNTHEMFILNADNISLQDEFTYGVLAHEFQHMIHWYQDRNEDIWLNEGFSELAAFINGYSAGGADFAYVINPDQQLTDWSPVMGQNDGHYGASFLFTNYFLDRFGEELTKSLVGRAENGLTSVDALLTDNKMKDPLTGQSITADDVFTDWTLANFLSNTQLRDGRYGYSNYPYAPGTSPTEYLSECPTGELDRTVQQYGVDYYEISCSGDYRLQFDGADAVQVIEPEAHSGKTAFWSNKGDESDMTLTREFDLSGVSGPITLKYYTWYDLEENYDYAYLEVADLDSETWEILTTPSGTSLDVSGNSYGWGYNGQSGGWIEEVVDLSDYAGKVIQVRFQYITDAAVNGEGMLIDDITIPEINYHEDFEVDQGGWNAQGFVRLVNLLPQKFRLNLILFGHGTEVIPIELDDHNMGTITLPLKEDGYKAVLVVSGTTRFTRQAAHYRFSISE